MDPDSKRVPRRAPRSTSRRAGAARGLTVTVSDGRGRPVPDGGLARWLARTAPARARGEVAIALATDRRVRALNREYRQMDAPTDVLSFPASADPAEHAGPAGAAATGGAAPAGAVDAPLLGDIVIATGVARRQAREARHAYSTELRVLALHGLLHLLGFDHHAADDRGRMARLESRLRRLGGLRAGLIERARA